MVHYLIQFPEPDATLIGERKDKTLGYDLTLQNHITTESGASVYDDVVALTGGVEPGQVEVGRKKPFAAEDRFPLVPGRYIVQSTLTNNLTLAAHRVLETVVVPPPSKSGLGISEPFVYSGSPIHDEGTTLPFSIAGVRFSPRGVGTLTLHARRPHPARLSTVGAQRRERKAQHRADSAPLSLRFTCLRRQAHR